MRSFDVAVIGGGVVGSAIARELSRYQVSVVVLERNADVCCETSGRNSAVVHGGFAYDTGTWKAKLCVEGCLEFDRVAKELNVPFCRTGKVLVGNTEEDLASLRRTLETGRRNGSRGLEIIDKERLHAMVPAVNGEFALYSPMSGIMDPFGYTVALAENAAHNGVQYEFCAGVQSVETLEDGRYRLHTPRGAFDAEWVVNSAGLGCADVARMFGCTDKRVIGSKGTYIILDKRVGPLLPMPVYPVPSNTYMGVHVTPTVDGKVIVGPDAEMTADFEDYGVAQGNIEFLAESARPLWPHIERKDYIRNYAGILPKWVDENGRIQDFSIETPDCAPHTVQLIGIESPGLTAALPIARRVVDRIGSARDLRPKPDFDPYRPGIEAFAEKTPEQQSALIARDPDYGEIVCRCGQVTKAEVLRAIRNPLGVTTVTGVKYRCGAMMGRCQGGYCQMKIARMILDETGEKPEELCYNGPGAPLFYGEVHP